jgi:hypothetical protein
MYGRRRGRGHGAGQDTVPIGFVLLEDCRVTTGDSQPAQITIAFSAPGSRAYVLEAKDRCGAGGDSAPHHTRSLGQRRCGRGGRDEAQEWALALQSASWYRQRQTVAFLQEEVERLRLRLPLTPGAASPSSPSAPAPAPGPVPAPVPMPAPILVPVPVSAPAVPAVAEVSVPSARRTAPAEQSVAPPETDEDDDGLGDDARSARSRSRTGLDAGANLGGIVPGLGNMGIERGAATVAPTMLADVPVRPASPRGSTDRRPSLRESSSG